MSPLLSFIIVLIGIYGLVISKNIIKSIVCLNITQTAVILLFLNFGNLSDGNIPIIHDSSINIVDPLPQALMITAIVIGSSITALSLIISIKIFHYYGTLNWEKLLEREG
ncbi:sodium:proton antiporter [Paramaledivibacter caminithermalis]|jgi:multicomponent Na+:H+ antiporter subunit C|uniref:Multicomponent Na+:H+ antiporter subunit C n=1 Tax=Paramaledivibacter caminithermalis (strain DSM 15212 / CIP 107654 / DViRD3) TaxID=1121301 RepID=A0A1M6MH63_PARC5|nr:cation:proton antiporter subunit C [Paramaledivibacter caminithermalis]SHJ82785.1 multicomponent Na+:H+ antiporter subunit C [Paramaledivibacter caminithermalis DSM 15212]